MLKEKNSSIKILNNFITISYEGLNVGQILIDDIQEEFSVAMLRGDIAVLPKNEDVINSCQRGIISYFINYNISKELGPPLVIYNFISIPSVKMFFK